MLHIMYDEINLITTKTNKKKDHYIIVLLWPGYWIRNYVPMTSKLRMGAREYFGTLLVVCIKVFWLMTVQVTK